MKGGGREGGREGKRERGKEGERGGGREERETEGGGERGERESCHHNSIYIHYQNSPRLSDTVQLNILPRASPMNNLLWSLHTKHHSEII